MKVWFESYSFNQACAVNNSNTNAKLYYKIKSFLLKD